MAARARAIGHGTFLEGLAQGLEMLAREFTELVEEQDASMREADLARLGEARAAADQPGSGDAVVWGAKWGPQRGRRAFAQRPAQRVDRGHLERRVGREVRKQGWEGPREHRLTGPGRAGHQYVVAARRGDLQRPLRLALTANRAEIGFGRDARRRLVTDACDQPALTAQVLDACLERRGAEHLETVGERGLRRVLHGHDEPSNTRHGETSRHRQDAGDRPERRVERELTEEREPVEAHRVVLGAEDRNRDRQVEARPLFGELGRSQVDGDPALRELVAGITDRRLDPLPCLLDRPVGEAHDGEPRQAVGDIRLDGDRHPGEASGRATHRTRNHTEKCSRRSRPPALARRIGGDTGERPLPAYRLPAVPPPTCSRIQDVISSSATGATVSSIPAYSNTCPVTLVWKR